MKFSELAEEWKTAEGPAIQEKSDGSYRHWCNALRAYILDWRPKDSTGKTFGDRLVSDIQRKDVQMLLNEQSAAYSESSLRSMKMVLRKVLLYAEVNGYIVRPAGWLDKIGLAKAHGDTLVRAHLTREQTRAFVDALPQPYSTLLLLASIGLRGETAIGLQPADLDDENVLHVRRIIYEHKVVALDKEECFPLDAVIHAELLHRLRTLGTGAKWILHSRTGTPLDLGNARNRKLHPAAAALGTPVGGWHDFRHALVHTLRMQGVHGKVISKVVGHASEGVHLCEERPCGTARDSQCSGRHGQAVGTNGGTKCTFAIKRLAQTRMNIGVW